MQHQFRSDLGQQNPAGISRGASIIAATLNDDIEAGQQHLQMPIILPTHYPNNTTHQQPQQQQPKSEPYDYYTNNNNDQQPTIDFTAAAMLAAAEIGLHPPPYPTAEPSWATVYSHAYRQGPNKAKTKLKPIISVPPHCKRLRSGPIVYLEKNVAPPGLFPPEPPPTQRQQQPNNKKNKQQQQQRRAPKKEPTTKRRGDTANNKRPSPQSQHSKDKPSKENKAQKEASDQRADAEGGGNRSKVDLLLGDTAGELPPVGPSVLRPSPHLHRKNLLEKKGKPIYRIERLLDTTSSLLKVHVNTQMVEQLLPSLPKNLPPAETENGLYVKYQPLWRLPITVIDENNNAYILYYDGFYAHGTKTARVAAGFQKLRKGAGLDLGDTMVLERWTNDRNVLHVSKKKT